MGCRPFKGTLGRLVTKFRKLDRSREFMDWKIRVRRDKRRKKKAKEWKKGGMHVYRVRLGVVCALEEQGGVIS